MPRKSASREGFAETEVEVRLGPYSGGRDGWGFSLEVTDKRSGFRVLNLKLTPEQYAAMMSGKGGDATGNVSVGMPLGLYRWERFVTATVEKYGACAKVVRPFGSDTAPKDEEEMLAKAKARVVEAMEGNLKRVGDWYATWRYERDGQCFSVGVYSFRDVPDPTPYARLNL